MAKGTGHSRTLLRENQIRKLIIAKSCKKYSQAGCESTLGLKRAAAPNKKSRKALKFNKKTRKITIKKGTKKGTYKMKITVTAAGNANYQDVSKTVTVMVKVK